MLEKYAVRAMKIILCSVILTVIASVMCACIYETTGFALADVLSHVLLASFIFTLPFIFFSLIAFVIDAENDYRRRNENGKY